MSDAAFRLQNPPAAYTAGSRTSWGAIWAGVFTFAAIWSVFEALAVAIFAGATTSVGMQVWTVVLTIIAMYVAGIETGRLANVSNRHDGLVHGIIMFGLSVVGVIIVTTIATGAFAAATARNGSVVSLAPGMAWSDFLAMFLGWIAAMGGASSGVGRRRVEVRTQAGPPLEMRPAA